MSAPTALILAGHAWAAADNGAAAGSIDGTAKKLIAIILTVLGVAVTAGAFRLFKPASEGNLAHASKSAASWVVVVGVAALGGAVVILSTWWAGVWSSVFGG